MRICITMFCAAVMLCACDLTPSAEPEVAGSQVAAEPVVPEPNRGEQLYIACQGCHSIAAGEAHRVGPNLHGIMDQPAATRPGFTYSDSLQNAGLTWTDSMMAAWIVDTETIVPGTWMAYSNILEGDEIPVLINYIRQASSENQEDSSD